MSFPDRYLRDGCSKSQEAERGGTPRGSTERLTGDSSRSRGQSRWVSSQTLRRLHSFCAEVGAAESDETRQEVVCRGGSHGVAARSRCSQCADACKVTVAAVDTAERIGRRCRVIRRWLVARARAARTVAAVGAGHLRASIAGPLVPVVAGVPVAGRCAKQLRVLLVIDGSSQLTPLREGRGRGGGGVAGRVVVAAVQPSRRGVERVVVEGRRGRCRDNCRHKRRSQGGSRAVRGERGECVVRRRRAGRVVRGTHRERRGAARPGRSSVVPCGHGS